MRIPFPILLSVAALLARTAPVLADDVDAVPPQSSAPVAPETTAPDATAPDATAPDATAPDATAPTEPAVAPPEEPPKPPAVPYIPPTPEELAALTEEERELYAEGPIDPGLHALGVVAAIFVGFGLGHVAQGRWLERGWIFTLGQTLGVVGTVYGFDRAKNECTPDVRCSSTGVKIYVGGMIALIGFYAGGVLETWITPSRRNARVQAVYRKLDRMRLTPYVVPTTPEGGAAAGLSISF